MKRFKILLIVCGLIFTLPSVAQVGFGFKAGANLSNMSFDIDSKYGEAPDTKLRLGLHAGIILDFPLSGNSFSFQPSVLYSSKGYSIDYEKMIEEELNANGMQLDEYEGYARMSYNYIEFPLNFVYKTDGFQIGIGPYVAVGIGGKFNHDFTVTSDGTKLESKDIFEKESFDIKPVSGKVDDEAFGDYLDDEDVLDLYRSFDYGFNLGLGYQVSSVLFNAGYSFGLGNVTPDYDAKSYDLDEDYTKGNLLNNRVITFSVSVFIN